MLSRVVGLGWCGGVGILPCRLLVCLSQKLHYSGAGRFAYPIGSVVARVAKSAVAGGLNPPGRKAVRVRVPPRAPGDGCCHVMVAAGWSLLQDCPVARLELAGPLSQP